MAKKNKTEKVEATNVEFTDARTAFKDSLTHPKLPKMTIEMVMKTQESVYDYTW